MSCNTMFKYFGKTMALLGAFLCLVRITAFAAPPAADSLGQRILDAKQAEAISPLEEGGDILLLYPDEVTASMKANIAFFIDAATCMNKQMVFVSASEALGHLSDYPFILCYDLSGREDALIRELRTYEGKWLSVGSTFLAAYLGVEETLGADSGILQYSFNDVDLFETSVKLKDIRMFSPQEKTRRSGEIVFRDGVIPFFSYIEGIAYCPVTEFSSQLLQAAMIRELAFWQWPYRDQPPSYAQFLVLDQVYPFMPAKDLMERIRLCADSKLPFVVCVMPIYQNGEFPAMQQFCEVLKYAQENGGAVILHAPIEHAEIEDYDAFRAAITRTTVTYTDHGVYPLGLAVPRSWTWDPLHLEFMKRYRTIFVYGHEDAEEMDLSLQTNLLQQNHHQLIMPAREIDDVGMIHLTNYSSALYVDIRQDMKELRRKIDSFRASSVPLKSLWDMDHSVWADEFHMTFADHHIEINGQAKSLTYIPEAYPEKFDYHRNTLKRITVSLKSQNRVLLIGGVIATIIFLGMIIQARIMVIRYFRIRNQIPKRGKSFFKKKE